MSGKDLLAKSLVAPLVPHRHKVTWRRRETADTVTFALEPIDAPLDSFRPGQFNMLYAYGVGEVPISVSGGPLVHTVRSVGAVSQAICEAAEDTVLGVRGPFGTDWSLDQFTGCDVVVVAGGIGLAPVRPAIHQLLRNGSQFGDATILIGARTPDDLIFREEIRLWQAEARVEVTVDHAEPGWDGHVGVVTELIPRFFRSDSTVALVCGPEVMIRFAAQALMREGLAADRILVSLERNMKCAVGHCGHCQFGPEFICRDGPVFPYSRVARSMSIGEL